MGGRRDISHDAGDVGSVTVLVASAGLAGAREVHAQRHAVLQVRMPGVDSRVDDRHADAAAGKASEAGEPAFPHLVCTDGFRRDRREHPHRQIAGERGEVGVVTQITQLRARDLQDRGILQTLLHPRTVSRGEDIHLIAAASNDDIGRRLDARRQPITQIARQPRAALSSVCRKRQCDNRKRDRRRHQGAPNDRGEKAICVGHWGAANSGSQGCPDPRHSPCHTQQ